MTPQSPQDVSGGAKGGSAVPVEGSGAQAGAQGVTEADRERAQSLLQSGYRREAIAGALAEERAKARAPFLRLASEFGSWPSARILSPHDAGDRIRQAAKEIE